MALDQRDAWNFPISWSRGVGEEFKFRTEILTSRRGNEQRIAQRVNPRLDYEFESYLNFEDFRRANMLLSEDQARKMYIPHPRRRETVSGSVTANPTTTRALCICIDKSGSMADDGKLASMKTAMNDVLDELAAALADGRLTRLDINITEWGDTFNGLTFADADATDIESLRTFVNAIVADGGATDFDQAAQAAVAFFNTTVGLTFGRRSWLFITDGGPNPAGSDNTAAITAADLLDRSSGVFATSSGTAVDCFGVNIVTPTVSATAKLDNTPEDSVPVVDALDPDALLDALLGGLFSQPITLDATQSWMQKGTRIFLDDGTTREMIEILRVTGSSIYTTDQMANSFGPGTKVYMALEGYFSKESKIRAATNRTGISTVQFQCDPVSTYHEDWSTPPAETLDGLEYLDVKKQWANDLEITFEQPFEDYDLVRGPVDRATPVPFTTRFMKLNFVIRNDDMLNRIVGLFYRTKGRQKAFYAPSYVDELRPLGDIAALSASLTIQGRETYDAYATSTVHRFIRIETATEVLTKEVVSITLDGAGNTVLNLDTVITNAISASQIKAIFWVLKSRFESDSLSLDWLTSGVAETAITIRSLEAA